MTWIKNIQNFTPLMISCFHVEEVQTTQRHQDRSLRWCVKMPAAHQPAGIEIFRRAIRAKKCPAEFAGLEVGFSNLLAAECILQSSDGILYLADGLLSLAFSLQLFITEDFSGGFFHGSLDLLYRTFDSILIHALFSVR